MTQYHTTPFLLEKTPKKHNILIGNDAAQIRFAERFLSMAHNTKVKCEEVSLVDDDMLLGKDEPQLYVVERESFIDLSAQMKSKVGIWSLDLLEKGCGGLNVIVRTAAQLLGMEKPDKKLVQSVADEIARDVYDINAAIWHAAWVLSGPLPEKVNWMRPWENWLLWLPKGTDPYFRLHSLYWELVMWTFAQTGDERGYRRSKGRWDQRKFQKLSQLQLPKDKVFNTLVELSIWRERSYDPYVCALKIAKIWET
jgi:hypothetical protein